MKKKAKALTLLGHQDAPRVFAPSQLQDFLSGHGCDVPARSLTDVLGDWSAAGAVRKINNQTYTNGMANPKVSLDEAAPALRPGAVISLGRALGALGVLNNPSHFITSVVPLSVTRRVGLVEAGGATFVFAGLPDEMVLVPTDPLYRYSVTPMGSTLMASAEKALCDWVYLAHHGRKKRYHLPQAYDLDFELLNPKTMSTLIDGLGLREIWQGVCKTMKYPDFDSNLSAKTSAGGRGRFDSKRV